MIKGNFISIFNKREKMKKSLMLTSLLALSTSVMAMDVEYFIGAGAERGDIDITTSVPSISTEYKDTALKLKAGVILDKTHRVSLSYVGYSDNGRDLDLTELNYDYIIPLKDKFSLLAGAHLGKADYKEAGFDMDGLVYGVQTGVLYDITSNIQAELGLAYSQYNVDKTISNIKVEFDDSTSLYLGLNYKF